MTLDPKAVRFKFVSGTPELTRSQLFVAGFPEGTEAKEVGELFTKYGAVAHVRLSAR